MSKIKKSGIRIQDTRNLIKILMSISSDSTIDANLANQLRNNKTFEIVLLLSCYYMIAGLIDKLITKSFHLAKITSKLFNLFDLFLCIEYRTQYFMFLIILILYNKLERGD